MYVYVSVPAAVPANTATKLVPSTIVLSIGKPSVLAAAFASPKITVDPFLAQLFDTVEEVVPFTAVNDPLIEAVPILTLSTVYTGEEVSRIAEVTFPCK